MLKLDQFLPYRLSLTSLAVSDLVATAYRTRFGLSITEWRIVAVLAEREEASQADLKAVTSMDKMMVSRATRALVDRGLITQRAHPVDGRATLLMLSRDGQDLYREVAPAALALEAELIAGLDAEEVAQLAKALHQVEQRARALIAAGQ